MKRHFYILSFLPAIKNFRDTPPIGKKELLALVEESEGPVKMVRLLLLADDLIQREAVLAGEIGPDHCDPVVLSFGQIKGKEPLPDFLMPVQKAKDNSGALPMAGDRIWHHYFHDVSKMAHMTRSQFLKSWVEFEVGLRNALAKARAEALKLDPASYLVAPELENSRLSFKAVLDDWTRASNPLEASEIVDGARWKRLTELEQWYSFSSDEIADYTARLMILHRWQAITKGDHQ